jgi:class 3 adenylate cyclase
MSTSGIEGLGHVDLSAPVTRYTRDGNVTIAYQEWGDGPRMVWVPGFISHVELNWEAPFFGRALRRCGEFARIVTFDKRGTGLSDHSADFGSFEDRVDDIRAVMDAVGWERAHIGGISEGGPLALLFAASFPNRVDKLVLYGTFARMFPAPDYPIGSSTLDALQRLVEQSWGSGDVLKRFAQHAPDPDSEQRFVSRMERYTATPQQAAHILGLIKEIDVRSVLSSIQNPTLVVHCTGDPIVPVSMGRYLAEHLPSCEFVELARDFHASWLAEDSDLIVDETERFLTGQVASTPVSSERVLASVLFSDIVDSTARARTLGDAEWRRLLDAHDAVCHGAVVSHRGRVVKTTGDGVLAVFDGPARAVRCAQEMISRLQPLGLEIRTGLHAGECEVRGDDVAGIAVNLAARVMHAAENSKILVTRTIKDLSLGSGLSFESRGHYSFKGLGEEIEIFAVTNSG